MARSNEEAAGSCWSSPEQLGLAGLAEEVTGRQQLEGLARGDGSMGGGWRRHGQGLALQREAREIERERWR